MAIFRSSFPDVFCKKSVLKNSTKLKGKHLCWSVFFNKVASVGPATLLNIRVPVQVLFCEFCEIFKNSFFTKHLQWLLLTTSETKPDSYYLPIYILHSDFRRFYTSNFMKLKNFVKISKGQGMIGESQDLLLKRILFASSSLKLIKLDNENFLFCLICLE